MSVHNQSTHICINKIYEHKETIMFEIKKISKSFGRKKVLSSVSFNVEPGSCVGLLGINGSGKSTLLNILAGCIKADSGSFGFTRSGKRISYLPQDNPLIPELSAIDNIKLWHSGGNKVLTSEYAVSILEKLGVNAFLHKKVKDMSGGMRKRLSLAITMMEAPDLLLLDEPLAALDMLCKNGILSYLTEYRNSGGSIIIATHEAAALNICTTVNILRNGTMTVVQGSGSRLLEEDYMRLLLGKDI